MYVEETLLFANIHNHNNNNNNNKTTKRQNQKQDQHHHHHTEYNSGLQSNNDNDNDRHHHQGTVLVDNERSWSCSTESNPTSSSSPTLFINVTATVTTSRWRPKMARLEDNNQETTCTIGGAPPSGLIGSKILVKAVTVVVDISLVEEVKWQHRKEERNSHMSIVNKDGSHNNKDSTRRRSRMTLIRMRAVLYGGWVPMIVTQTETITFSTNVPRRIRRHRRESYSSPSRTTTILPRSSTTSTSSSSSNHTLSTHSSQFGRVKSTMLDTTINYT